MRARLLLTSRLTSKVFAEIPEFLQIIWMDELAPKKKQPQPDHKTPASELSRFLLEHMRAGTGQKDGKHWTGAHFAKESRISQPRLSSIRTGKEEASLTNLRAFEETFFPAARRNINNPAYRDWLHVKALQLRKPGPDLGVDVVRYTSRDAWNLLLSPIRSNSTSIIREGGSDSIPPYFEAAHIKFNVTPHKFILPIPGWFRKWATKESGGDYEIHEPMDLGGSLKLDNFFEAIPIPNFRVILEGHIEAYAREVRSKFTAISTFPPYNKEKLGLYAFQQPLPAGRPERAYMSLWLYQTDYFTHRVMRRVLHEIRPRFPSWFEAKGSFFEDVGEFLRYFTTSFGLNLVVTTNEKSARHFHMVRLASHQGNENQRNSFHVSANEGLNMDDVKAQSVKLVDLTQRTLSEELGVTSPSWIESTVYIEFAMEMRNFEPYLSGLTHLNIDDKALIRAKSAHARDDRRETTEIVSFPFTERGVVDLLLENSRGTSDFSTYALLILDSILSRGLARYPQ
jgi:hypothetical protein